MCDDNSGSGVVGNNGTCGFLIGDTPCLQCKGANHGCGPSTGCMWRGEDCPVYQWGGESCDAACPADQSCPMNQTDPTAPAGGSSAVSIIGGSSRSILSYLVTMVALCLAL